MTLSFRIDVADEFIEVSMRERVSVTELVTGIRDLIDHRDFERTFDCLIDCSKTEIVGISPKIVLAIRDITPSARGGRRALIVPSGSMPIMLSLYLRLRGDHARVRTFKTRQEGFLWLGRTPDSE